MSRRRRERGEAVTETVVLVPALLLLIMLVVQFGLWYHAQHVVQAAAQEGARAARAEGSTAEDGLRTANAFLSTSGGDGIESPDVEVTRDGDVVVVEASARAPAVVPGLDLGVRASATSPTEGFRAP